MWAQLGAGTPPSAPGPSVAGQMVSGPGFRAETVGHEVGPPSLPALSSSRVATLTASGTADPELGEGAVQLFSALRQTSGQPYQTTCGPRGPSGKGCSHRETQRQLRLAGTLFTWGKCISF